MARRATPPPPRVSRLPAKFPLRHIRAAVPIASHLSRRAPVSRRCIEPVEMTAKRPAKPAAEGRPLLRGPSRRPSKNGSAAHPNPKEPQPTKTQKICPAGSAEARNGSPGSSDRSKRSRQPQHPIMLSNKLLDRPDAGVEMHVLDHPRSRPAKRHHLALVDQVERKRATPVGPGENEPVVTRHLVARPVDEPEELAVELGGAAYVGAVEARYRACRDDRAEELSHGMHPRAGRASGAWRPGRSRTPCRTPTTWPAPRRGSGCGR